MKFVTVLAVLSGALAVPTYGEGSTGVSYGQPGSSGYGSGGNGGSYPVPGNGNNPGGNGNNPGGNGSNPGGDDGSNPGGDNGNNPGGDNGNNPGGDNGNNPGGDNGNNPGGDNGNNPGGDNGNNPGGDNGNNPGGNGGGDQGSGEPLCSSGLYSQPQCCATDVLGLADLDCSAPTGQVNSPDEFKASCGAEGSEAKCCVIPVLGQSLLCQDPL